MRPTNRRCGFTLLEAAISMTLFGTVMMGFAMSVDSLRREEKTANVDFVLVSNGFEVLDRVGRDLQRSGLRAGYPLFFDDGAVGGAFPALAHPVPNVDAQAVAAGQPTAREIVFQMPSDADDDGWPDLVGDSAVNWDPVDLAFVLVPSGNGTNDLRRIGSDGSNVRIAGNVQQLLFESPADTGFTIPLDAIRVRLTLANSVSNEGRVSRRRFEAVFRMHNGDPIP